jgi:hypothetical protein
LSYFKEKGEKLGDIFINLLHESIYPNAYYYIIISGKEVYNDAVKNPQNYKPKDIIYTPSNIFHDPKYNYHKLFTSTIYQGKIFPPVFRESIFDLFRSFVDYLTFKNHIIFRYSLINTENKVRSTIGYDPENYFKNFISDPISDSQIEDNLDLILNWLQRYSEGL